MRVDKARIHADGAMRVESLLRCGGAFYSPGIECFPTGSLATPLLTSPVTLAERGGPLLTRGSHHKDRA